MRCWRTVSAWRDFIAILGIPIQNGIKQWHDQNSWTPFSPVRNAPSVHHELFPVPSLVGVTHDDLALASSVMRRRQRLLRVTHRDDFRLDHVRPRHPDLLIEVLLGNVVDIGAALVFESQDLFKMRTDFTNRNSACKPTDATRKTTLLTLTKTLLKEKAV